MTRPARRTPKLKTMGQLAVGRAKGSARHVYQFQIACLELERTRRLKELFAATRQVESLQHRLAEIDREIAQHQRDMDAVPPLTSPPAPAPASRPEAAAKTRPEPRPAADAQPRGRRRTLRY